VTQAQWIVLLLKVFCVTGFASIAFWIAVYSRIGKWWASQLGWSLVAKSALLALLLANTAMSLFFHISAAFTEWADTVLVGAITPVMCWRTYIWVRLHGAAVTPGDSP